MTSKKLIITKLDAARRQLDIAIRLFFKNEDEVSIHTLACASEEIVNRVADKNSKITQRSEVLALIRPERRKEFSKILSKEQNFFKHSDGNYSASIVFNPAMTEFTLIGACRGYLTITGEQTLYMKIFSLWFYLTYPDFLADPSLVTYARSLAQQVNPKNRLQFFNLISRLDPV